jgi:pimeloyl-ACP methyl ester carboxylesterase
MTAQLAQYEPPSPIWSFLEPTRAAMEMSTLPFAMMTMGCIPRGDGHPVMVLPGFMGSDSSTVTIRNYLTALGYEVYPWALGRNLGRRGDIEHKMVERANHIAATHGQKVSLVGWSLGGIFARQIARDIPDAVRQVITLGSPFGSPGRGGTNKEIAELYEMMSGENPAEEPLEALEEIWSAPPVPSTAIFSKSDGVAAWEVCIEQEGPLTDNVEVHGSHTGLGFNPVVLYVIGDRLSLAEDEWTPFDRSGMRGFFYS